MRINNEMKLGGSMVKHEIKTSMNKRVILLLYALTLGLKHLSKILIQLLYIKWKYKGTQSILQLLKKR